MSISSETLRKLTALKLDGEQLAGVLELLADAIESDDIKRAAARERTRRYRDKKRNCDVTVNVTPSPLVPPSSLPPAPPSQHPPIIPPTTPNNPTDYDAPKLFSEPSKPEIDKLGLAVEAWNELAQFGNLAKVSRLTEPRRKALKLRLKELGGLEEWAEFIERISRSPLLMGKIGNDWKVDFDWIIKPANFIKITEGKYDPQVNRRSG